LFLSCVPRAGLPYLRTPPVVLIVEVGALGAAPSSRLLCSAALGAVRLSPGGFVPVSCSGLALPAVVQVASAVLDLLGWLRFAEAM
jgi:hypothetical protein